MFENVSRSIHTTTLAKMKIQSLCHHNLELKLRTALGIKQVARMPGLTHTKQVSELVAGGGVRAATKNSNF